MFSFRRFLSGRLFPSRQTIVASHSVRFLVSNSPENRFTGSSTVFIRSRLRRLYIVSSTILLVSGRPFRSKVSGEFCTIIYYIASSILHYVAISYVPLTFIERPLYVLHGLLGGEISHELFVVESNIAVLQYCTPCTWIYTTTIGFHVYMYNAYYMNKTSMWKVFGHRRFYNYIMGMKWYMRVRGYTLFIIIYNKTFSPCHCFAPAVYDYIMAIMSITVQRIDDFPTGYRNVDFRVRA